jgi:hypothetical protein
MTKEQSFDITLGSDDYVLARGKNNAPSISLGSMPIEPGSRMQIDSIVVPSLHKGFGELINTGSSRYYDSDGLDASIEGVLYPAGVVSNTVTATNTVRGYKGGGVVQLPNGTIFYILPGGIWSTSALVRDPQSANSFTGSWALHGNYVYFGRFNHTTNASVNSARYQWTNGTWDDVASGTTYSGPDASFLVSFGNKMWWVENEALGTQPKVYWSDSATLAAANLRGPYTPTTSALITWIYVLGPYAIYMLDNGTIAGIDTDGVFAPLMTDIYSDVAEPYFGHGTCSFMGNAIVPHSNGLLMVSNSLNEISEIGPYSLMKPVPLFAGFPKTRDSTFAPSVVAYKNHIWYCDGKNIWHGVYGKDGMAWHYVTGGTLDVAGFRVFNSVSAGFNLDFMERSNSTDYIVKTLALAHPDGYTGPLTTGVQAKTLTTPFFTGDGMAGCVTKRAVTLRGNATLDSATPTSILFEFRTSNESSWTTVGTYSTANGGFFTLSFPVTSARLGRGFQLKVSITPGGSASGNAHLNLPLYLDYEYVPSELDYVRFNILASSDPVGRRGAGVRRKHTKENIITAVQALIGTITTVKMNDSGTTWTVLVEDYNASQSSDGTVLNSGESIVEVICRRLS